jgi:uncharacterized repeat protein (TIGR03843 family)
MSAPDSTDAAIENQLCTGAMTILGRMPWSSNATFLVEIERPEHPPATEGTIRAVYKPHRGERPLWDFPDGLYKREVAAYRLSEALAWQLVPLTVLRDGPLGTGSVQLFVDADFDQHYFTLYEEEELHPQLQRVCAFDLVVNNTDRKSGHVLVDSERHLWGIDNGLSFHVDFKLRTVIWEFGGAPLPNDVAEGLTRLLDCHPGSVLSDLLDPMECDAVQARAAGLLSQGRFPVDSTGRRYPWPLV